MTTPMTRTTYPPLPTPPGPTPDQTTEGYGLILVAWLRNGGTTITLSDLQLAITLGALGRAVRYHWAYVQGAGLYDDLSRLTHEVLGAQRRRGVLATTTTPPPPATSTPTTTTTPDTGRGPGGSRVPVHPAPHGGGGGAAVAVGVDIRF